MEVLTVLGHGVVGTDLGGVVDESTDGVGDTVLDNPGQRLTFNQNRGGNRCLVIDDLVLLDDSLYVLQGQELTFVVVGDYRTGDQTEGVCALVDCVPSLEGTYGTTGGGDNQSGLDQNLGRESTGGRDVTTWVGDFVRDNPTDVVGQMYLPSSSMMIRRGWV